jgi:hypothetical protein
LSSTEKQEGYERIDPKVYGTILQQEQTDILYEIKKLLKESQPEGVVDTVEPVTVTDQEKQVTAKLGKKWFSVSIVNDGPDSVWVLVNTDKSYDWHEMKYKDTYKVDMNGPKIKNLLLKCDKGKTAIVRIVGVR